MKKTIKIFISVVLTLSILLVPMTVFAAKANYKESSTRLSVDKTDYEISTSHQYTTFEFKPREVGKYIITSNNFIGFVGYNWVEETRVTEENVSLNSYDWECTAVGQSIYIAVKNDGNSSSVTINITKEDIEIELPISRTPYKNVSDVKAFTFTVDADALEFVDVFDTVVDTAVLGNDGYYHLNDANGPVLYVNVCDAEFINLIDAVSYGQLVAAVFENDKHVATIDYNEAFTAYYNAAYKVTEDIGLYPLTDDLIEIYQKVGLDGNHNWYGESGRIIGSNVEDGWLFATMYVIDNADSNGDNNNNDNSNNNSNNSNNNTGNNSGSGDVSGENNTGTGSTSGDNANTNNNSSSVPSPTTNDCSLALSVAMLSTAAIIFGVKKVKQF